MKIISHIVTTNESYKIQLEDNVILSASLVDGKLTHYSFKNNLFKLHHINDIEPYKNSFWNTHSDLLSKEKVFTTLDELKEVDISKLYYIGGGLDGMLRNHNGVAITSVIRYEDIFSYIYLNIGTLKKSEKYKEILEKSPYISNFKIVEIPYYNRDNGETHTITFDILLPDDLYKKYLAVEYPNRKSDYLNEEIKTKIVKDIYIQIKEKIVLKNNYKYL